MRIRWIIVCVVLLIISLLVTSCGIPQDEYDAVVIERDSTQSELQSTQGELESVSNELDSVKSELQLVNSELTAAQLAIETQSQSMAKAKIAAEIVNALFIPILKGEEDEMDPVQFLFDWKDRVEASGDDVLQVKFDALMDSQGGDKELTDFFLYCFECIPTYLE